jgi:4-hydroxy-tetrahydrodipicolinate synthase
MIKLSKIGINKREEGMKSKIVGIIPAMVTAFDKKEEIDEKRTRSHVNFLIENGVHGIAPVGSTGELIAMTIEERKRVTEIVIDEAKGRVPIYPGTGHYSTKFTIELSQHAEKSGASGVMVILPYYMQPPHKQVMEHFRELASNISIPILLYNNPWFAGYELSPWDIAELAKEGVVSSVKCAHGDADRCHDLKFVCGNKITALYGHDYCAPEAFLLGADGWLSGLLNVCPRMCRDLYEAAVVEKDVDKTRKISMKMMPLIHFVMYNKKGRYPHWLSIFKTALNLMGRDVGAPRKPLKLLEEGEKKVLKNILKNMRLL